MRSDSEKAEDLQEGYRLIDYAFDHLGELTDPATDPVRASAILESLYAPGHTHGEEDLAGPRQAVTEVLIRHPRLPGFALAFLLERVLPEPDIGDDARARMLLHVYAHPNIPAEHLGHCLLGLLGQRPLRDRRLLEAAASNPSVPADVLARMCWDPRPDVRRLARAHPNCRPEDKTAAALLDAAAALPPNTQASLLALSR